MFQITISYIVKCTITNVITKIKYTVLFIALQLDLVTSRINLTAIITDDRTERNTGIYIDPRNHLYPPLSTRNGMHA